jgi:adenylate cyclase
MTGDTTRVQRRLAAILAADVVGFSALMSRDEEGTHAQIKWLQQEVFAPAVQQHQGRVVKTTGDGFLIEFASPVEAVRCALEVQKVLASSPLQLRIGINLGDVIIEPSGDIYGEGVNVAARLEALCEPGGILISGKVFDEAEGKVDAAFESRGEQPVKNIPKPVRVYALAVPGTIPTSQSKPLPLPDRPSIAVLPFTNMSGDTEQEYFADGIVEDIITALSRVRWFFVIARNSSFTYKGKPVDIRQVGRELGVRYVLEGSIRKAGQRVRITGQLIEATTGRHVWADKFDGSLENIFDLQDQITEAVVGAIEPSLRAAEVERAYAKPTDDLDAYDLYLRALPHYYAVTKPRSDEALRLLGRALDRAPDYSSAKALAVSVYNIRRIQNWADDTEIRRGIQLAREVWADHRDDPTALSRVGVALANLAGDFEAALAANDRALMLNPNSATAYGNGGLIRLWMGDWHTAIELVQSDMRLNPLDPGRGFTATAMCIALLHGNRPQEALEWAHRGLREMPTLLPALRGLIVALVELGRLDEAQEIGRRLLAVDPTQTVTLIAHQVPFRDSAFREKYFRSMRAAGIAE